MTRMSRYPRDGARVLSLGYRPEGSGECRNETRVLEIAHWYCIWYHFLVTRAKHQRILKSMFQKPTPAGIRWADVVAMLETAGVEVSQRSGSRVLLKKGADRMVIHRPHPETETGKATVRDIAAFLETIGVNP